MNEDVRQAEQAVLGSMLRDNGCIATVAQIVNAGNFYEDAHQRLFRAALALYGDGRPVDVVTLADELHKQGRVEDVGGYSYLSQLLSAAPTAANAEHYARIVRDHSIVRRLEQAGAEIMADASSRTGPPEQLLDAAERRILSIAQMGTEGRTVSLGAAISKVYDSLDATMTQGNRSRGLATGFIDLDQMTAGLHESELVIIAARPSVGKTALSLALARNALRQGHAVFIASLEQRDVELTERLLCCEAGVDGQKLRAGTLNADELARLKKAGDALRDAPLFIDDNPNQSMLRIAANARRLKLREGIGLVVIDYLQLIDPENRREPRHEQVAGISRRLKQLARELALPVVSLAQLNRHSEYGAGREPRLSDLRDSGGLEQDADLVLLMHKQEDNPAVVEVNIAKQRNGPVDKITLVFRRDCQRFENYAVDL